MARPLSKMQAALALLPCVMAIAIGIAGMRQHAGVRNRAHVHGSLALQGSALLITYYSGVVGALLEAGRVQPGVTPLRGISGGAWTATLTALGHSGAAQRDVWKRWVAACHEQFGGCQGHVRQVAKAAFDELLPETAAQQVSGKLHIALAQLDSQREHLDGSASWLVGSFSGKEDLKNALAATSYIPGFSGPAPFVLFRGQPVIDGGFANGFKQLCGQESGDCLKVASWHVGPRANHSCDPARCGSFAGADRCVAPERKEPIPADLFKNEGPQEQWPLAAAARRCPTGTGAGGEAALACSKAANVLQLPDFVPHNQVLPDIHPGKNGPLPTLDGREVLACEWQSWAMQLPPGRELEVMDLVYEQGWADGAAWARQHHPVQQHTSEHSRAGLGSRDEGQRAPGNWAELAACDT
ncbi:hypothetical protein ABPG77_000250 [Micractinium sp. CCAP 211/92]